MKFLYLFIFAFVKQAYCGSSYTETITTKRANKNLIQSLLEFNINDTIDFKKGSHLNHLDLNLYKILEKHDFVNVEMSLTKSLYDHDNWNKPLTSLSAFGMELLITYKSQLEIIELSRDLIVLFCGTVNFEYLEKYLLFPSLTIFEDYNYARINLEDFVCTENLNAFKDLLPCPESRGLKSLLKLELLESPYFLMKMIIDKNKIDNYTGFNVRHQILYINKPSFTQEMLNQTNNNRGIKRCVLSQESSYEIADSNNNIIDTLPLENSKDITNNSTELSQYTPPINFITYTQVENLFYGRILIEITNNMDFSQELILFDTFLPDLVLHIHTLKAHTNNQVYDHSFFEKLYFKPSKNDFPHIVELKFKINPLSTIILEIEYETYYLKAKKYSSGSERGFYNFGGVITTVADNQKYYSDPIYIKFPVTDNTMPYAVLTISSTIISLLYGPLYQIGSKDIVIKN